VSNETPEEQSEHEVEEEAAKTEYDPVTHREAEELELMEEHDSKAGEHIGDEVP
jgi:hypothetical protein